MLVSAFVFAAVATSAAAAAAAAAAATTRNANIKLQCATGVHILIARGTGNDQATGGALKNISDAVIAQVSGSDVAQIIYPASRNFSTSIKEGVENMRMQIQEYTACCPTSRLVLLGFSQGAQVIGDLLTGNGVSGTTIALKDKGTGAGFDGRNPRKDVKGYDRFRGKIVEFCTAQDYYCASGPEDPGLDIHRMEASTQKDPAIQFIVDRARRRWK